MSTAATHQGTTRALSPPLRDSSTEIADKAFKELAISNKGLAISNEAWSEPNESSYVKTLGAIYYYYYLCCLLLMEYE